MSTRANVIIKDECDELIFYRHSDGYPEGTLPTLEKLLTWVKDGRIRDNVGQAAGWLILIGAEEYRDILGDDVTKPRENVCEPGRPYSAYGWKCGAYEPETAISDDSEFLYVVDLAARAIHIEGQNGYVYEGSFAFDRLMSGDDSFA